MRRAARLSLAALATVLLVGPTLAQGVGGRCDVEVLRSSDSSRFVVTRPTPGGPQNVFFGAGFLARCLNQDVRLAADSAEWYQQSGVLYLIGHVRYTEPRVRVNSDRASYFQNDERLFAEGNVDAVLPSGSTMRGPQATYYRPQRGVRVSRLEAPSRPRFTLAQQDSAGRPQEPVLIIADRVVTTNDSLVYAGGRVEITRTDFDARSDSAYLDSGTEFARLIGNPVARGKGDRSYTLKGTVLDIFSRDRAVQRVLAKREARAASEDLLLTSDTIDLRVDQNRLQGAFAWGASRARAVSPDRDLVADSLWVRMPDQRLRELRAFRNAYAQTIPDTAQIRSGEKDWLRGDTIFAWFDSTARGGAAAQPARAAAAGRERDRREAVAARDSARAVATARDSAAGAGAPPVRDTSAVRLLALEARGNASARTQVASEGSGPARPAINYSRGTLIRVTMDSTSEVSRVLVEGRAVGLYLEPVVTPAPRDSAGRAATPGTPGPTGTPSRAPVPPVTPASTPTRATPAKP